jgi:hypothetical protein
MAGDASFPWMSDTARALAEALPEGKLRILEGQTHDAAPEALAAAITEFSGA